jgi:hypothetical protein
MPLPKDLSLLLSTTQLGSSTSRAFVGPTVFGDSAMHVVFSAAEKQGDYS